MACVGSDSHRSLAHREDATAESGKDAAAAGHSHGSVVDHEEDPHEAAGGNLEEALVSLEGEIPGLLGHAGGHDVTTGVAEVAAESEDGSGDEPHEGAAGGGSAGEAADAGGELGSALSESGKGHADAADEGEEVEDEAPEEPGDHLVVHGEGRHNASVHQGSSIRGEGLLASDDTVPGLGVGVVETVDSEVGHHGDETTEAGATAQGGAGQCEAT